MNMHSPPEDPALERRLTVLETRFDTLLPTLATKSDLQELRAEIYMAHEKLGRELRGDAEQLRREFIDLRTELFKVLSDQLNWTVGIMVSLFIANSGVSYTLVSAMRHTIHDHQQAAQQSAAPTAPSLDQPRQPR